MRTDRLFSKPQKPASAPVAGPVPTGVTPQHTPPPPPRWLDRWNTWYGFFGVLIPTALASILELAITGRITWIAGIVFVLTSGFSAFVIQRPDLPTAVISPPLAFLGGIFIGIQPSVIGSSGNWLLQEVGVLGTTIALNAPWVFGGTAIALAIALVREYRYREQES